MIKTFVALIGLGIGAATATGAQMATVVSKPAPTLRYLKAEDFVPTRVLPAPPARGSQAEAIELETVHRLIAAASPQRLAQAAADGAREDPSIFDDVLGVDLKTLPATWALLVTVQKETDTVVDMSKRAFARVRPYGIDQTLPTCTKLNPNKAGRSYPSGHAGLGWSNAWVLAALLPERAPQLLARANDYALSRQLCAVHFPSDTEASHALATLTADRLLADPRLASSIAAARAELRHKLSL